jgi:uncharacterized protein
MPQQTIDPALLALPDEAAVALALQAFAAAVRSHYGDRLRGLYLFGSRARGDHMPDSDADVAVVLADGEWVEWQERYILHKLAYDPGLESGLVIQPWPFSEAQWRDADHNAELPLARAARRSAVPVESTHE